MAGATPKDTVSEIESYSAPKRLSEWVSRAARPSSRSKIPATRIAYEARSVSPVLAFAIA